eukprot:Sdes_comp18032_c0_seq6m7354
MKIAEQESIRNIAEISDRQYLAHHKALADSEFYSALKMAESNKLQLTKEYLELKRYQAITKNLKIYFGPSIPNIFHLSQASSSAAHSSSDEVLDGTELHEKTFSQDFCMKPDCKINP